ncbi:MAG: IS30 family transposase [Bacteroides sp.]|nr:IS30 family transposase [Bacteroides sp.]MCM1422157.1 IS30 family transposase [Bacteroides sp.]
MHYHQVTSEQRSQIFVLLQKKATRKEIARLVGVSESTLSREFRRNRTHSGKYLWNKAHEMAMSRRRRTTENGRKDALIVWEALEHVRNDDWSPKQVSGYMRKERKFISHELIYRHIRADESGELAKHCRHGMRYNRHGRQIRTTKVKNIPDRKSIHDRPVEADGKRFGDWEMDTIVGKNGKGAILTLTERSTNFILMEKLEHGKEAIHVAKAAIRLLLPYRGDGVRTITTDNGSEFCAHGHITKVIRGATVYFADSYCSWQKGAIENANKLIRQYVPKGTDFKDINNNLLRKVQAKINARPREKLNFSTPKCEFFKHFH